MVPFSFAETREMTTGRKQKIIKLASLTEEEFQRAKTQLLQRVEFIILGLRSMGLQAVPLNSLEIIELLWSMHHISEAERGYYPEIPEELVE